jgi:sigma-B regulation protein RsbU (phosphoserine phosphatase)
LSHDGKARWALTTKVPFHDREGRIVGLVGISHDITRRKLAEQELRLRSDEMEADLQMARQIQEAFFPRVYPSFPAGAPAETSALRFAHRYVPAATLGGDFFDVIAISDTLCGVLVCDVMGHGVRAGLLTALIRGVIEECSLGACDPARVLGEVNRSLMPIVRQTGQPVFASAFFGVIDLAEDTLAYANAGHPPPFLLRRSRGVAERLALVDPEPAAGLVENFSYSRRDCAFAKGDAFLGYTDGLFEASDAAGAMLGEPALLSLIEAHLQLPGPQLVERLLEAVESFTGRRSFEDDICVLMVER